MKGSKRRGRQHARTEESVLPIAISPDEVLKLSHEYFSRESSQTSLNIKTTQDYIPADKEAVQSAFVAHMEHTLARSRFNLDNFSSFLATSLTVRDRLIELFNDTQEHFLRMRTKMVYFVSFEYFLGCFLRNALMNLELEDLYRESLSEFDIDLDSIYEEEKDPGLGSTENGSFSACFIDTLATHSYPACGYGLFYDYGNFKQIIVNGKQVEVPEYWLQRGEPFRIERHDVSYDVSFYGTYDKANNKWTPKLTVKAVANDFLIPGFATDNTLCLRLWSSKPTNEVDANSFAAGNYAESIKEKQLAESITSILYPQQIKEGNKEMKLMQEALLASATLHDIIHKLKNDQKKSIEDLPSMAAIHMNSNECALMVIELIRILIDEEHLNFPDAFKIASRTFSFTCDAVNEREIEKWSVDIFQKVLPRHMDILYQANAHYLETIKSFYGCSDSQLSKLSLIEEGFPKMINMSRVALMSSHSCNGVSEDQSQYLQDALFKEFSELFPEKFTNKTSGVSITRWIDHCNPELSGLITKAVFSPDWKINPTFIEGLIDRLDDKTFYQEWDDVKHNNKIRLAKYIYDETNTELNPELQMFVINTGSINSNKRQAMSIFYAFYRYLEIVQEGKEKNCAAFIYSGKAKQDEESRRILQLLLAIKDIINSDIHNLRLRIAFVPNYNVSVAEKLVPGADVFEDLSVPGSEAYGMSDMKFVMNGALLNASRSGPAKEIESKVGTENVFTFDAGEEHAGSEKLNNVLKELNALLGDKEEEKNIIKEIMEGDKYHIARDFESFCETKDKIDVAYSDHEEWSKMSMACVSSMSFFSSDRTATEYAEEIFGIGKCRLPPVGAEEEEQLSRVGSLRRHHSSLEKTPPDHV